MKTYRYIAMDSKGSETEGTVKAENQSEAINLIRSKGFFPTKVIPIEDTTIKKTINIRRGINKRLTGDYSNHDYNYKKAFKKVKMPFWGRVKKVEVATFARSCSTMVEAGLPLLRALHILHKQEKNSTMKDAINGMGEAIEGGSTFSEALSQYPRIFDNTFVNMVKAGEAGGVLDIALTRLADFIEKGQIIKRKTISAFSFSISVSIVISVLLSMLGASLSWNPALIASIVAVILCTKVIAMYQKVRYQKSMVTFSRTLGTLMNCGVPVLQALNIVRDSCGSKFAKATQYIHDSVREGETIALPMESSGLFPDMVIGMVDVGEETGALPDMLFKVADIFDDYIDASVSKITTFSNLMLAASVIIVAVLFVIEK